MEHIEIYKKHAQPPSYAIREIIAGRLKGKSDINPQWRIEALTETYGLCGFGWYYEIAKKELAPQPSGEVVAFVEINLFVKIKDEWSKAIVGTGGSMLVANEKNGLYVSDEAYKMATTDAISVACKQIGIASNIYMGSKYTPTQNVKLPNLEFNSENYDKVAKYIQGGGKIEEVKKKYSLTNEIEHSLLLLK